VVEGRGIATWTHTDPEGRNEMYQPEHTHRPVPEEPQSSWTGYALVKYGFIFLIVIAILYFLAVVVVPALTS
jgi:hypothetical protein